MHVVVEVKQFGPVVQWIGHQPSKLYGGGSNPSGTAINKAMLETSDILDLFETSEFQESFWNWFDHLPKKEKSVFMYYRDDMAKLYFYNKYYKHNLVKRNEESSYFTVRT